ncbi:MAG: 23S rRNA (adenine(2503)-C(2))-methyltransferase RlmN [Candidatus Omnitrophota bacterium]|jgi:23S rRNA (adenine2503-C2)-methyltransferase
MENIRNLTLKELETVLKKWGVPVFHGRQIFSWLYKKGVSDFDAMTDLADGLRKRLKDNFCLSGLKLIKRRQSRDSTGKFLFELGDRNSVEAVSIPAEGRVTGCVSTQAGCRFACRFCASAVGGFKRDLSCAEMLEEILYLKNNSAAGKLSHLVFMGTGEPLDNYDNVMKAIRIINSREALNIGARRITISTCGLIPAIKRLAGEGLQVELSVSLHAADDKVRSSLMPVNKKYPLKELIRACRDYAKETNRQITFEYVLINGLNADLKSAGKLCVLLEGFNCKVNLIPANPIKELRIEPPNKLDTLYFKGYLSRHGLHSTLRKTRGQDIEAACGQLRIKEGRFLSQS